MLVDSDEKDLDQNFYEFLPYLKENKLEILYIVNKSTDDSWNILKSFAARTKSVKIHKNVFNQNRNWGIKQAKGRYIMFIEPGCYIPNLSSLLMYASNSNKTIIGGVGRIHLPNGSTIFFEDYELPKTKNISEKSFFINNKIFKTSFLIKNKIKDSRGKRKNFELLSKIFKSVKPEDYEFINLLFYENNIKLKF